MRKFKKNKEIFYLVSIMRWDERTFSKFTYLENVSITRQGDRVAYVTRRVNLKENKYENTIVIENLKTGERRYVDDAVMPKFSPDGKKMLYLHMDEEKKKSDLYLLELENMTSKKLMEAKNILDMDWNHDSRKILVLYSKKLEDEDMFFDDSIPAWFNGKGFHDMEKHVIQIYDTEGEIALEEIEDENVEKALWHGNEIVYSKSLVENPFKYYTIVSYRRGRKREIATKVNYMAINSNGRQLLLLGKRRMKYISEHRYLYIWDNGKIKEVNEKYGLTTYGGKIDTKGKVYAMTPDAGNIHLDIFENDERLRITEDRAYVYDFDVSNNGVIAMLVMSDTTPGELYIYDGKIRKHTSYNDEILKKLRPIEYRRFQYSSFDGKSIDGWYLKPRGAKKSPMVVKVHGGPKGMYGYLFNIEAQMMVHNGFYVLMVNPRGSAGYDEKFALEVIGRLGLEDFQDIMKGVEWMLENENVDPERIGITGISYGGFMTNWAITQSDKFKAAISENGISNWFTSYAFSDIGLWYDREMVGHNPFQNREYRKLSPIFYADRVKTPVLFIHSLEDYRCPLDQSLMFYHVLKAMNKEAYIAIFKKGEHGHSVRGTPRHRMKRYRIFLQFFARKLKEGKEFNIKEILEKH